jgi:hypothetical protein
MDLEAVRKRLEDQRSQSKIAMEYGIHQTCVSAIKRRKSWRHIAEERGGVL